MYEELIKRLRYENLSVIQMSDLMDEAANAIECLSRERKTGKWTESLYPGHEHVYCSECKTQWFHDDLYLGGNDFPKFCPECGVSMDNWETVAGGE